ncbi:hypothetical protein HDV05_008763 [Chytridiales sp. JEL 0842]|nr:hypothetical protein HDV05_008763 [Chytridiales sp. JEL 0842]
MTPSNLSNDEEDKLLKQLDGYSHVKVTGCDIDGIPRGKLIDTIKLKKSLREGFGFCNVVFGWDCHDVVYDERDLKSGNDEAGFPDILALPDLATLRFTPFENNIPHILLDFDHPACPRSLLKRIIAQAATDLNMKANVGIEYEFYNFKETPGTLAEKGGVGLTPLTKGMFGYSTTRPLLNKTYFYGILENCEKMGIPLEGLHTETGPGVYEAAIRYGDALETADRAHLFKHIVKSVGIQEGVVGCFMAKPYENLPGCSGHIHVSISSLSDPSLANLFSTSPPPHSSTAPSPTVIHLPNLSRVAHHFLAGILEGLPSIHALLAPTINSYKRLVSNFWAPMEISYGFENRTTAIRIIGPPNCDPQATRFEIRVPGADSNPYLAVAGILACGFEGVRKGMEVKLKEGESGGRLSRDLREACDTMGVEGSFARQVLGDAFVEHFVGTRRHEWGVWERAVTGWELKRYMEVV